MHLSKIPAATFVCAFILTSCQHPDRNTYSYDDVGKSSAISFGTLLSSRPIDIIRQNTGAGATIGAGAGTAAGLSIGRGLGSGAAGLGGALIGAAIGAAIEKADADRKGIEYLVVLESGVTVTIAQEIGKGETPLVNGERVIIQNSGGYQRVLLADTLPTTIARVQGLQVVDTPPSHQPTSEQAL